MKNFMFITFVMFFQTPLQAMWYEDFASACIFAYAQVKNFVVGKTDGDESIDANDLDVCIDSFRKHLSDETEKKRGAYSLSLHNNNNDILEIKEEITPYVTVYHYPTGKDLGDGAKLMYARINKGPIFNCK